jgi:hypothetical protein
MVSFIKLPNMHKEIGYLQLMELETVHLSFFDDEELISKVSFLENEFTFRQNHCLQTIYQLQLLEFVQLI